MVDRRARPDDVALCDRDAPRATPCISEDDRIDNRYLEIHEATLSLIAREAPVATDLRTVRRSFTRFAMSSEWVTSASTSAS